MKYVQRHVALALGALLLQVPAHAQTQISWAARGAQFKAAGSTGIKLTCPPRGALGSVWGSGVYTDDSSVCTAAVHAGAINAVQGGTILLRMRPGLGAYAGTFRNGVTSQPWEAWEASFSVERALPDDPPEPEPEPEPAPRPAPPPPPSGPDVISWEETASRLAPNGRRFTFVCRARGTPAAVVGADLYSWNSSICTAAVHAGVITIEKGGVVTIEMRPGARAYGGTARNGITSLQGERTTLGFIVVPPTK